MLKLIYSLVLTVLPFSELRLGMPLAVSYAIESKIPLFLIFSLVVLLNVLLVFFVFFFLDNLHKKLINFSSYKKTFDFYLKRFRKKIDKLEKKHSSLGFLALTLFVAVPLPGTGAWTGCLASWLLGFERKKSILAISIGVAIAGAIIFLVTLGFLKFLW